MATRPATPRLLSRRQTGPLSMPRVTPFTEQGVVGTVVYSGYIHNRERSPKWSGQQKYITIADMAVNTSIIAAGVRYTSGLVAHPKWAVHPAVEGDAEAEAAAELVESIINDLNTPWSHVVRRAYMYKFYGFGLQEWTAKRRLDGKVGLATIAPRPQFTVDRWEIDDAGIVAGVWQLSPKTGAPIGIPRSKLMYLVDNTLSDSPEGVGVFRHLAEPWERLKMFHDLEARAFERDLRGIPIGRIPYTLINEAVKAGQLTETKAKDMVKSMEDFVQIAVKQSDTGLTIDSAPYVSQAADGDKVTGTMQWGLELLQGAGGGMVEIASSIKRTQFEMATIMCVQQLLYGMEGTSGNRALSKDMSQNLYLMANASLTDIAAGVDHDIIGPICLLNNIPDAKRPKCEVEDVAFKDAESVANTLSKMAQAGAVLSPDDPVIQDVRELMGVSAPTPISPELIGVGRSLVDDEGAGGLIDEGAGGAAVAKAGKGNPNHAPAGSSRGGEFTSGPAGGGAAEFMFGEDSAFSEINEALRGDRKMTPEFKGMIGSIDGDIATNGVVPTGALYRGLSFPDNSPVLRGMHTGGQFDDAGYTATTTNRKWAESGLKGDIGHTDVMMRITSTKAKAIYNPKEKEYLFGRNAAFKVNSAQRKGGVLHLDVTLIGRKTGTIKAAPRTLYVQRRLLNGDAVRKWATSQGIESTLPPDDMHVTVAFSKTPLDWSQLTPRLSPLVVMAATGREVHQFPPRNTPNGALVLKFGAPVFARRWQEFRDAGASWDFPEYQPHITLTYSVPEANVDAIEPYRGPLVFGPEIFAEVNDNWGNEIVEIPTGVVEKMAENQPRKPKGDPEGGQWTDGGGGGVDAHVGYGTALSAFGFSPTKTWGNDRHTQEYETSSGGRKVIADAGGWAMHEKGFGWNGNLGVVASGKTVNELIEHLEDDKAGVNFYHGTSSAAVKSIMEKGLMSGVGAGADAWAKENNLNVYKYTTGERKLSVYLSDNQFSSKTYASYAKKMNPGSDAIILSISVPKDQLHKIKTDEYGGGSIQVGRLEIPSSEKGFRFVGKIPPGWIKRITKKDSESTTIFAVVLVKGKAK